MKLSFGSKSEIVKSAWLTEIASAIGIGEKNATKLSTLY